MKGCEQGQVGFRSEDQYLFILRATASEGEKRQRTAP